MPTWSCIARFFSDSHFDEDNHASDTSNRRLLHGSRCERTSYPCLRTVHGSNACFVFVFSCIDCLLIVVMHSRVLIVVRSVSTNIFTHPRIGQGPAVGGCLINVGQRVCRVNPRHPLIGLACFMPRLHAGLFSCSLRSSGVGVLWP